MKKTITLIITACLILLTGCSTVSRQPLTDGVAEYQEVVEVDADKTTIYNKTLQWMAEGFRSAQDVIQYKDEGEGVIIGKGVVDVTYTFAPYPTHFTLKVEAKDGRYRVTFFDMYFIHQGAFGTASQTGFTTSLQMEKFSMEAKRLSSSIKEYITGNSSGGTW